MEKLNLQQKKNLEWIKEKMLTEGMGDVSDWESEFNRFMKQLEDNPMVGRGDWFATKMVMLADGTDDWIEVLLDDPDEPRLIVFKIHCSYGS